MSLLKWREDFSIGIESVDAEHRELIDLINTVYERGEVGQGGAETVDLLGDIYAGIAAHFALEEREMRIRDYPRFIEHKDDHERLLEEICDIMDNYEIDRSISEAQLSALLERWFAEHFSSHDALLHTFLD